MKKPTWKYEFQKVKEAREAAGLTVREAAGAMPATPQQWQLWEDGKVIPTAHKLARICKVTNRPPSYFFVRSVIQQSGKQEAA